jgi:hypothetical protein
MKNSHATNPFTVPVRRFRYFIINRVLPLFCPGTGRKGYPFISNYNPKSYDAYPQCWSITQDHQGVMYFGNGNQITEFDGSKWSKINFTSQSQSLG